MDDGNDVTSSEDIFEESLLMLGGGPVVDSSVIGYGPLKLSVARKEGKANTLLADHLFSPALFLAERIERGLIDAHNCLVVELGAGAGLPSLLLTTLQNHPSRVVITDFPDENILSNLNRNIANNRELAAPSCQVRCIGYEWGKDTKELRDLTPNSSGYDVVILSDLLHFHDAHDHLVSSVVDLLSRDPNSRAHISAGKYTKPHVCQNFVDVATRAGLLLEEWIPSPGDKEWRGQLPVSGLSTADLAVRKEVCRYWVARWA